MAKDSPESRTAPAVVALLLVILVGGSVVVLNGGLRYVLGAVCLIGLLLCIRVLARSGGAQSP